MPELPGLALRWRFDFVYGRRREKGRRRGEKKEERTNLRPWPTRPGIVYGRRRRGEKKEQICDPIWLASS